MKKLIFILVISCSLLSCGGGGNDINPVETYAIKEIDGCEYIYVSRRPWVVNFH